MGNLSEERIRMQTMRRTFCTPCREWCVFASSRVMVVLSFLVFSGVLLWQPSAVRAQQDWTSVGSTGTVDEADRNLVAFNGGVVGLKTDETGKLNIRYNVVAVSSLFGGDGIELGVRFLDNGPDAQVVVRLRSYSLETGGIKTLLTLDSDRFNARENFQLRTEVDCSLKLDFFTYAYFLDVTLTKNSTSGTPALAIIQLASIEC